MYANGATHVSGLNNKPSGGTLFSVRGRVPLVTSQECR